MHAWCRAELSVGTTRRPLEEREVVAVARQDLAGTKTWSCSMHRNNERGRMLPCWQFWHFDHNCTKFHHPQMSRDQHCELFSAPETASLFIMLGELCLSRSSVGGSIWLVTFDILVEETEDFQLSLVDLKQNTTIKWLYLQATHTHTFIVCFVHFLKKMYWSEYMWNSNWYCSFTVS